MDTPTVPINFVPAKEGEIFKVGNITIRIMEDGSRTGLLVMNGYSAAVHAVVTDTAQTTGSEGRFAEPRVREHPSQTVWSLRSEFPESVGRDQSLTLLSPDSAEFTVPPHTHGPPPHWHEMHDETFLVTQGTLRFHALNGATIDAKLGDYVTVPPRAPHTFSNPYDQEAKFFNTYTPAFYINYFRLLGKITEAGQPMNPEANRKAMAYFATIGVADDEMQMDKQQFYEGAEPAKK